MRKRTNAYIGLAVCVLLFVGLGYFFYKPKAENMAPYLSFSADLDGTKAFVQLLGEKGQTVETWKLPVKRLPAGGGEALLLVQPSTLADEELKALGSWIEQGNDVLLFTSVPPAWDGFQPDEAGEPDRKQAESVASAGNAGKTEAKAAGESTAGTSVDKEGDKGGTEASGTSENKGGTNGEAIKKAAYMELRQISRAGTSEPLEAVVKPERRLKAGAGVEPLLTDELGLIGARKRIGGGELTIVLAPNWLMNGEALKHKHFELAWPLFERRWETLRIDEYHHGIQTKPGLFAAYPAWLLIAGAQLALALALWLWMRAKRIGPVHVPRAWTARRGDETLLAVAGWYERRKLRSEALAHSAERLRQLLWQRWGVAPGAAPQEAASAARIHWDADRASRLERLLHLAQPVQGSVGAREFTARVREYGEFIAELEKE